MDVGIIGLGWVGRAMQQLFPEAVFYDPNVKGGVSQETINQKDVAFICVPTPNKDTGVLDISAVEKSVAWCECPLIIIRSTVNPGDTDYLADTYGKNIVMQPEYLGETANHPLLDPTQRKFLILGGSPENTEEAIHVYQQSYNANVTIRQVSAYEAEIIKLTENRAIAFKVAQCQELYDACKAHGVDYNTIREAVYGDDPRFNLWWTFVYPDNRGMNSKCIPKDVYAWAAWAESAGYDPQLTNSLLRRNERWISGSQ